MDVNHDIIAYAQLFRTRKEPLDALEIANYLNCSEEKVR